MQLGSWPREVLARVNYTIRDVDYDPYLPPQMRDEWRRWYKPCGSFRLFLPVSCCAHYFFSLSARRRQRAFAFRRRRLGLRLPTHRSRHVKVHVCACVPTSRN